MPQLRDFLARFRPAGAPGAAARAGVPVDRLRELADELSPVLALLDGAEAECGLIIAQAREQAQEITADARARAIRIAADADQRASAAKEETVRQALAATRTQAASAVAEAEQQAAAVSALAERRIPVLADYAIGLIRQLRTS